MTDKTDLIREIHEYVTTHGGENTATHLLVQAASAIQTQAAELEAVGAGGVQALSAVPAGWKLVPVEPTNDMQKAADEWAAKGFDWPKAVYRAMLAASPTPPAERPPRWVERWHGSGGKEFWEGWSILNAANREMIAHLGPDVDPDAVRDIVAAHNEALCGECAGNGGRWCPACAGATPTAEQQATKETSGGFHVWRDISTAPKDGSRFVATGHNYGLYSEVRHTCVAQWFRGCWMEASDWNETSELKYLTHWMPLPSPPDDVAAPAEQQTPRRSYCDGTGDVHSGDGEWRGICTECEAGTATLQQAAPKAAPGEPVHGDVLPPVGSRVYIRHGRDNGAHACTVTGYYAWGDLGGDKRLHRVFVRLVYEGTDTQQARMLCDCHPTAEAALSEAAPQQEAQEPVAVPRFNCWSTNEGDSWFDHPADSQAIYDCLGNDAKVGDEYELTAGWTSVTARYRITEVVGDGEEYEVECISHPHENSAPQPAPVVGRMSPSKEWLETRLAIADDSDVQAGVPSKNARPCDAPPGCDSHNCHGCDDFKHPSPTPQPAPAPLIARSLAEWHEEDGYVAWWAWNGREWAGEPAWIGTPNCEDWPGYHTHWTPHPDQPVFSALAAQERQP